MAKRGLAVAALMVLGSLAHSTHPVPGEAWPPGARDKLGWDTDALAEAKGFYEGLESAALNGRASRVADSSRGELSPISTMSRRCARAS